MTVSAIGQEWALTQEENRIDTRQLLLDLETPFQTYAGAASVRDVVLAGLRYPTSDYWVALALTWLEHGAHLDFEIVERLSEIASASRQYEQRTRHRASRLVKSWNRQHLAQAYASDRKRSS